MTLLSNICNKTNGVLSHMRPSIWPARQDTSQKASPPSNENDPRQRSGRSDENDAHCRRQEHNVTPRHDTPSSSSKSTCDQVDPGLRSSSSRRSCPENRLPHSDEPLQRSGRCTDNGRFHPIDDALSFATTHAPSRSLGSSTPPASTRYAELSLALDLFDTARSERTRRYSAVEGMLHLLEAEAEERQSAN